MDLHQQAKLQELEAILIHTYHPDPQLRHQAENALRSYLRQLGGFMYCLHFLWAGTHVHRDLRQATAIVVKNNTRDFWSSAEKQDEQSSSANESSDSPPWPSTIEEREMIKAKVLDVLLAETDNSIRDLIAETVKIISEFEFPQRWPELVPILVSNIQSPDALKIYNSLLALRKIMKRYEYKSNDDRRPLNDTILVTFPAMQQLMSGILHHNSLEAAAVMRMCLKVLWSCTMHTLPNVGGIDVNLWFQLIAHIMNKPLPEASENIEPLNQPLSYEDRKKWPWWKLKKWAARIMSQFIQRYGNPRFCSKEFKAFSEYFRSNTAALLLGPAMTNLEIKARGGFITDDVQRLCLNYVAACVEMSPTYKVLKPHLDFLLFQVVFPTLCISDEDIRLFNDDPVEFVRKVHNPLEDWLNPLIAATNLLQMMARYRQKDTLPRLMPYLHGLLSEYSSSPVEMRDYKKKDGVLVTIAVIAKILLESNAYKNQLHPFLIYHVIPEFQSPVPFIRSRACWVIEYFNEVDWKENNGSTLQGVLQGLLMGLKDPAIPVQAAAACSMRLIISAEGATDLIRPMLRDIIGEYFRIMDQVESESVLSALQAIVLQFGVEIADMAPTMVQHLINIFNTYAASAEDDEAAFNASQCLDTIAAILEACDTREDVLLQLEPIMLPLLKNIFTEGLDCFEYIDNGVQFMGYLTYSSDTISSTLWVMCGPLLQVLYNWGIDYITEIMVPILNYLSKDIDTFLNTTHNGQPLTMLLLSVVEKVFSNDSSDCGKDSKAAATMLTCLVTCCHPGKSPGPIDSLIPNILYMTLTKLNTILSNKQLKSLRVKIFEIVLAVIYYNPLLAIAVLSSAPSVQSVDSNPLDNNTVKQLFSSLFSNLKDMESTFTQRLIVLSFTSLLTTPLLLNQPGQPLQQQQLPEIVSSNLPNLLKQALRELVMIAEEEEKEGEEGEGGEDAAEEDDEDDDAIEADDDEEDDDDDDDDQAEASKGAKKKISGIDYAKALHVPDGGYDEDEDCINAEDESYREALEVMEKEEKVKRELFLAGEAVDDEDDENEDFTFTSPVESIDIVQHFLDTLRNIEGRDANLMEYLRSSLDNEDHQRLADILKLSTERKERVAAELTNSTV
mmetsp:Transcript_23745/g.34001  ORF Transcript_23745/g.34001 Transcript_23745/m.34001 type:complete len:1123 (-) Transcript_23745:74-3442(-)|eukprot:CAMPEP_0170066342 /NCGR_PEP_ID=MMETSP0019_2-20121128/6077_1 /TAXON_ID=98059 /ORGANISM="Dinobryon sp., Strain UTEXLB2267" /LENGTH=1122 /DNA_ID=CAMNT_0010273411 /DNA_START=72 /DNA_END=3440 /DNA_ORIENTATION=+